MITAAGTSIAAIVITTMPITLPSLKPLRGYIETNSSVRIHKMAAIAFTRNGYIVAIGYNQKGGHGYVSEYSKHCEEMVLKKSAHFQAQNPKKKLYLLVVRLRSSDYGLAKPCDGCYKLCRKAGIQGIYYTTVQGIEEL